MVTKLHTPILERYAAHVDEGAKPCEWPGCKDEGPHRAPRSKDEPEDFRWFCKDHARQYNKAWNFFEGMTDHQVEAIVRHDTVWNRPSWPIGSGPAINAFMRGEFSDPFEAFSNDSAGRASPNDADGSADPGAEVHRALAILGLDIPVDVSTVKANYKALVKRHHPDAQGRDTDSDDKIKQINHAYQVVMSFLET